MNKEWDYNNCPKRLMDNSEENYNYLEQYKAAWESKLNYHRLEMSFTNSMKKILNLRKVGMTL